MISMGFPPLYSVAMAQPFQGVACTSGSIANMLSGSIDYGMAAWITVLELIGFYVGIIAAYRMNAQRLKTIIAYLCIVTGGTCFSATCRIEGERGTHVLRAGIILGKGGTFVKPTRRAGLSPRRAGREGCIPGVFCKAYCVRSLASAPPRSCCTGSR